MLSYLNPLPELTISLSPNTRINAMTPHASFSVVSPPPFSILCILALPPSLNYLTNKCGRNLWLATLVCFAFVVSVSCTSTPSPGRPPRKRIRPTPIIWIRIPRRISLLPGISIPKILDRDWSTWGRVVIVLPGRPILWVGDVNWLGAVVICHDCATVSLTLLEELA